MDIANGKIYIIYIYNGCRERIDVSGESSFVIFRII